MLLTLVALHIAPEALAGGPNAWLYILGGALLGFSLQIVSKHVGALSLTPAAALGSNLAAQASIRVPDDWDRPSTLKRLAAATPLVAIALHSLVDGAIYGLAFTGSQESGIYAVLALIIHEIPEAFVAFTLAAAAGLSMRVAFLAAFTAASLTTPIGAAISVPLITAAGASTMPALFALSAGLLLFVALGPLLSPMLAPRGYGEPRGYGALGAGVVAAAALLTLPMSHAGHGHIDAGGVPVHAHIHDDVSGDGHAHPNFSPFR